MNIFRFSYTCCLHPLRAFCLGLFFLASAIFATLPASAAVPAPTEKVDVSPEVEQALNDLIESARAQSDPQQASLDAVLAFCSANVMGTGSRLLPERKEGVGVLYHRPLPFSFADMLAYTLNPAIPNEAILPNCIRRNAWDKSSPFLTEWKNLTQGALPPGKTVFSRGVEYEQITPDENSGAYYGYKLRRLFALTPANVGKWGKTALFSVAVQDGNSEIGLKGAVLGKDSDWNYVYTGVKGSTLRMVGWAETYIYGTATINVWVENEPGSLYLCSFKWLKAGWSGMNVVKAEHINNGITRYLAGLSQTMGSAKRPSVKAILARNTELRGMNDEALAKELTPFAAQLAKTAKAQSLDDSDFTNVLKDDNYAQTLSREDRIAELMKLFMKQQLGMPAPGMSAQ